MALAASRNLRQRAVGTKIIGYGVIATGAKIYKGAILARNAAGRIKAAGNAPTDNFAGIAEAEYDAGDGAIATAEFSYGHEVLVPVTAGTTVGLVNDTVIYAVDDETGGILATLGPPMGRLKGMEPALSGYAWVHVGVATQATQT
jgi:hypothetical protein